MSKNEQEQNLTTKQIAQGAVIAYIAVKTTKALAATVVNTMHFRRARKANAEK